MRHPNQIAAEMEHLADERRDTEHDHMEADTLLIELIQGLCPSREHAPPVHHAVQRTIQAWRRGAKKWSWACDDRVTT